MFHLLRLKNVPILKQLQLEEALLRLDERDICIINTFSSPAIVMGISSKIEAHLNLNLLEQKPVPVIRRFSGGGTVFVDRNTIFVTFIGSSKLLSVPCYPENILQWTKKFYPDLEIIENDYVIGDRKVGGNAQYIRKDRFLHHTSFLWDYDPLNMRYLLYPPKTPTYRRKRTHLDFLGKLKDHYSCPDQFLKKIINQLSKSFMLKDISFAELSKILHVKHRKSTVLFSLQSLCDASKKQKTSV